jgi:hypothetical protein
LTASCAADTRICRHKEEHRWASSSGGIRVKPFLIALGLFFLLLAIAVFLDWKNVVDDPKVYSGMVTTLLGAVIGFLGGDATGTAASK